MNLDLTLFAESFYHAFNTVLKDYNQDNESQDYNACSFMLNDKQAIFRTSKITPAKTGQFVTVWKRNANGVTAPFHETDRVDFFIISSRQDEHIGQFIFPKQVLIENGIIESAGKPGKRGIRVYPPWDIVQSKQAEKTQEWQLKYFITCDPGKPNTQRLKDLIK